MTEQRLQTLSNHLTDSHPATDSFFSAVELAPPDTIFDLTASYKADPAIEKVNLSIGAYRDDQGRPWVLPVVQKVNN
jgi:aspartate aminotransferase